MKRLMIRNDGVVVEVESDTYDKFFEKFTQGWSFKDRSVEKEMVKIEIPLGGLEADVKSGFFRKTIKERGNFLVFGNYRETQYWIRNEFFRGYIYYRFDEILGKNKWKFNKNNGTIKKV